jgi:CheY-like chemotaxis protein
MTQPKALIVEDEAISARAARYMLEALGCLVTGTVDSGEEALAAAEQQRPDFILMDIRLKGEMSGIEAAALIRRRLGIHSVFVSAYTVAELSNEEVLPANFHYIGKPIDEGELAAVVEHFKAQKMPG